MTLTRDSALWWWGMFAAIVLGLGTLGNSIVDYGLPVAAVPYIRLAALVVGIVSGKLATSPLLGKNDLAPAVNPATLPKQ